MTNAFTNSTRCDDLKTQLAELKKECAQVDMTDEFAKYARLQRKILKVQDEVKKIGWPSVLNLPYFIYISPKLLILLSKIRINFVVSLVQSQPFKCH